jgi:hypothetical protein
MKDFVLAWKRGIDLDFACAHLVVVFWSDSIQDRSIALETIERLSVTSLSGNDGKWDQLSTAVDHL